MANFSTLMAAGFSHRASGNHDNAINSFTEAARVSKQPLLKAQATAAAGAEECTAGRLTEAARSFERALAILESINTPESNNLKGRVYRDYAIACMATGNLVEAAAKCRRAVEIHHETDSRLDLGMDHGLLARVYADQNRVSLANSHFGMAHDALAGRHDIQERLNLVRWMKHSPWIIPAYLFRLLQLNRTTGCKQAS